MGCVWEWQCCQLPAGQGSKGSVSAQLSARLVLRGAWTALTQLLLWQLVGLQSLTAFPSSEARVGKTGEGPGQC